MIRFFKTRKDVAVAIFCAAAILACHKASASSAVAVPAAPSPQNIERSAQVPAAHVNPGAYSFKSAEKAAVEGFLRQHTDLRLATDADRQGTRDGDSDVRRLYGVYHPFFVRGDLNDDGILDFILAFVRRDSGRDSPGFSVVVFIGRADSAGSAFHSGAFIERDVTLARGDLSIDRDAVLITPDLADEAVRRYRWDPLRRSYVFVRDDAEEEETPIPSRT
jgi:hypothetical protein